MKDNIVIPLNKYSENRGDLYVIEESENLTFDFNYYYITNDLFSIKKNVNSTDFTLLIIEGELKSKTRNIPKGTIISNVVIDDLELVSDCFTGILMSKYVLNYREIIEIPSLSFKAKRLFFVDNMPRGSIRGNHAHKIETEFLYAVKGKFEVKIRGVKEFNGIISEGEVALSLPKAWTSVKSITNEGILLAFLSHKYDASGFIKND